MPTPIRWTTAAWTVAFVALFLNTLAARSNILALVKNDQEVTQSHRVKLELEGVLSDMQDAETGQRGFLITDNNDYLEPYRAGTARVVARLAGLRELTADDPDQQGRIDELAGLVRAKLMVLDETIAVYRKGGREAARAVVLSDRGKRAMDAIRAAVAALVAREDERLAARTATAAGRYAGAVTTTVFGGGITIGMVGLAFFLVRSELARRERAAAALRESEERFRSMADSVPVMIWVSDPDRKRTYFNRTWLEFTGRSLDQQLGEGWVAGIHRDDRAKYLDAYTAAFDARRPFEIEYRLLRHDGVARWVLARGSPRFAPGGGFAGFSGLCMDITDRKEAVEAVRESDARKSAMFESALDCVISIDAAGRVLEFNPAAERTFGYTREEAVGREMAELIVPPAMRDDHRRGMARYLETGEGPVLNRRIELIGLHRTGAEFPVEVSITPIAAGGRVTFTSYLRDITERKRAEENLAERARLAALRAEITARCATNDSVPVVLGQCVEILVRHLGVAFARVWTLPDGGDVLELRASAGLYTHLDGPHARVPVGRFKIGRIAATRAPHLSNDVAHDPEVSDPAWAAREGMVAFAGYPLVVEGKVVGVLAMFARRPLSDAVLTDLAPLADGLAQWLGHQGSAAAVRASEERFRTLAQTIPQLVWTATPAGACDYLSRQWAEYTGRPAEEQLGAGWLEAVHPDDRAGLMAEWGRCVAAGEDFDIEFRIRGADGAYRWFKTRAVPARGADGAVVKWIGSNTDIDDQKRAARTLEQLVRERTAELRRSNGELEQFAYVASHDLQEPLRKIQAFGDRLRDKNRDQLTDPGKDYLDRMLASAGRMSRLIDDLLTFSRVTTQARPFVPTDLNAVLADVLDDLDSGIERAGAEVDVGPLPPIDADPTQVRQLFQNLLGNALKFRKPDVPPVIRVRGELLAPETGPDGLPGPPVCRLEVADNGIGFDEKYLDRIFQVFQRLHGRGEYEGTGVGLAVCKKIADRHGGTITARSEPGAGATFIVLLPARHPAPADTTADTTTANE